MNPDIECGHKYQQNLDSFSCLKHMTQGVCYDCSQYQIGVFKFILSEKEEFEGKSNNRFWQAVTVDNSP